MPWKQLVRDPDVQKQALEFIFKLGVALLPVINHFRITRNTKAIRRHSHAQRRKSNS